MAVPPPGMERGTVRVKCLAQEHNTMAQTRIALLKVEHPNHEVSAPPKMKWWPANSVVSRHNTVTLIILPIIQSTENIKVS